MSIPKEPRQIMINLMYLVLTAMLALNISSEILNAFKTINDSIEKSNSTIVTNNNTLYNSLSALSDMEDQKARVQPFYNKAKLVKSETEKVIAYLDTLKNRIIKQAGGISKETGRIEQEGDIDIATRMFIEGTPQSKSNGAELKKTLTDYRAFILSQVEEGARSGIASQIPLTIVDPEKSEENPQGDWAVGNFFHMPTIAAVTMFSKYQNDLRNSEAMVVQELMHEADAGVIKFDAIKAIAVPKTSYALKGQKIEAQIMLAAYNKTLNPTVSSSSGRVAKVQEGVAYWETQAQGVGMQTVRGQLTIDFNGKKEKRDWDFQYMVGSTGASMQLDKMNVFYIGVENPITVTAAGYSLEDVSVEIPGATTVKSAIGKYSVTVPMSLMGQKITAQIKAKTGTSYATVATQEVRVKRIPDPIAKVANKAGTIIMPANQFRAQLGIIAVLENFDFDTKFTVVSFDFSYIKKKQDYQQLGTVHSALFRADNAAVTRYMEQAGIGDQIFLDNIKAKGPDGSIRSLGTIRITLN